MQEPGAYSCAKGGDQALSLLLGLCNFREAEKLGHYRWRYGASQFFPHVWCGEEGKGCQGERVSHLKAASNSVLLGNAHFFFFYPLL